MREWRNWQTRTFEGRVVHRTGSSPVSRTNKKRTFVDQDKGAFFE